MRSNVMVFIILAYITKNNNAAGVTQYTLAKLVTSALISGITMLSFKMRRMF
jgi:hypothetical protein